MLMLTLEEQELDGIKGKQKVISRVAVRITRVCKRRCLSPSPRIEAKTTQ
jgi:hypothetical protein